MERLLKLAFVVCLLAWPIAWWNADRLPSTLPLSPTLDADPLQHAIAMPTFGIAIDDVDYAVEPSYQYSMDGIVVSYRLHDGNHLMHRLWNDHLNVADLCVVWGHDLRDVDLHAFEFANGEFTCTFRTDSDAAWRAFRQDQISNNHLITADSQLRARIRDVAVGDHVHFEGYLSSYSNRTGFRRASSTTREDTGDGACETVYVTSFDILDPAPRGWRRLEAIAVWGMLLSAAAWLLGVARGWF